MNFPFPQWTATNGKKQLSKADQATTRLRFMINYLALLHSPSATYVALAKALGIHHTTLNVYIQRGSFGENVAQKIEKHFGPSIITADMLINPNNVK